MKKNIIFIAAVFAAVPAFAGDFALNAVTAAGVAGADESYRPLTVKIVSVQPSITSDAFEPVAHTVAPAGNSAPGSNTQPSITSDAFEHVTHVLAPTGDSALASNGGNAAGHQKPGQALLDNARGLRDSLEKQLRDGSDIADDLDDMRSAVRRLKGKRDDDLENRICDRNLRMIGNASAVAGIKDTLTSLLGSAAADDELFRVASDINRGAAGLFRTYNGYVRPSADGLSSEVGGLGDNLMGDTARACAGSLYSKARNIERDAEDILLLSEKFYNAAR